MVYCERKYNRFDSWQGAEMGKTLSLRAWWVKSFILSVMLAFVGYVTPIQAIPVTFSDGVFNDADWTADIIQEEGPTPSFGVWQVTNGGNPDEYRHLQHSYGGNGSIMTAHLQKEAIYDPGSQGAISTLALSFDLYLFDGGDSRAVDYRGLIFQNDSYYIGGYASILAAKWESHSFTDLVASDFTLFVGTGPSIPDFSTTGSPLQFGYVASNGTSLSRPTSTQSGIDNWSVSIQPYDIGSIAGTVTEAVTEVPLNKAIVIVVNADTKEKAKTETDEYGNYEIPDLEPGDYWVICIKRHYKIAITSVDVVAGPPTIADFSLISR